MFRRIRARTTGAHLMAAAALFVALGGSALAAGLGKDSVGTKQLKAGAVKTDEINDLAVTAPKLADNAATGAKVDEGSLGTVPRAVDATNATNATSATSAADSSALEGRPLARVVSEVSSDQTQVDRALTGVFTTVANANAFAVDAGPADVVAQAAVSFYGTALGDGFCRMEIDIGAGFVNLGAFAVDTVPAAGQSGALSLVGHADNVPSGVHPVRVVCREFDANDLMLDSASLVITTTPE